MRFLLALLAAALVFPFVENRPAAVSQAESIYLLKPACLRRGELATSRRLGRALRVKIEAVGAAMESKLRRTRKLLICRG
jgi:hypothetical protein